MESPSKSPVDQTILLKEENQRLILQNQLLNEKVKKLEEQMAQLLLQKTTGDKSLKGNVSTKKCSHGHHNHDHSSHSGHGHNHSHNHGHNHHDESSEEENPSEPAIAVLTPPAPKNFLHTIFKTQEEINFRYFRLPLKTIKAWKKDENIDLTKNKSCMLHLREMKLNVQSFVKQTWEDVEWINLPECEIDDEGWRLIVQNSHTAFPDLRVIGIRWNKIKTIKEGDFEKFKQLRMIDLGLESDENNPLSPESRQVIKKFTESHPNIKIE